MAQAVSPARNPNLLSTDQAAQYLGVKPSSLATWRCTKAHRIAHVKIGRLIYYRPADLDRFLESAVRDGEATANG